MSEDEACGMKGMPRQCRDQSVQFIRSSLVTLKISIVRVTDDRSAQVGCMHSNLMGPSRLQSAE